jgi:glycosyltransferase involved in cell wall biosynthesis
MSMGDQTETKQLNNKNHRITSIIAAYNEEKTIGPIIDVLKSVPIIEQIVVVSDGSTDRTVDRMVHPQSRSNN